MREFDAIGGYDVATAWAIELTLVMRRFWVRSAWLLLLIVGRDAWATEGPDVEPELGPQPHPQLTPLGYQLSAQKEHALALRRQAVKAQRLNELGTRLNDARAKQNAELAQELEAIVARVDAGAPAAPQLANAWGSEHVAHMRALDQWTKYGAQLDQPQVVAEFDKHALRIAKLRRVREVIQATAASTERDALLSQVETTVELEGARHVEQLERWLRPVKGASR